MIELGLLSSGLCVSAGTGAEPPGWAGGPGPAHASVGAAGRGAEGAGEGFGVPMGFLRTWGLWGEAGRRLGRGIFSGDCWYRGWVGAGCDAEVPSLQAHSRVSDRNGARMGPVTLQRGTGMGQNFLASSQGAFPPLFFQPLLLQKRKSPVTSS